MRRGRDGEKKRENWGGGGTGKKEKTDENSGHYVIASRLTARTPTEWNAARSCQLIFTHFLVTLITTESKIWQIRLLFRLTKAEP